MSPFTGSPHEGQGPWRRSPTPASPDRDEDFRLLVESVEDAALLMLDPGGRITSWNVGAERIKGHRAEDILGRHFSVLFSEEDVAVGRPRRLLSTAEARGKARDEGWRVRADGSRFYAHVVLTALRGPDGELRGFAKVTRDITARRETEARLREAQESLRRGESLSRMGTLVAGVAHEVRNPLFGISATLDALEAQPGHPQPTAHSLTLLRREVSRLDTLMRELLTYGRPRSTELQPGPLSSVLDAALDATAALAREREVRVEPRVEPDLPRVAMEPGRLTQVFHNLLTNALQHSPRGGTVWLTARHVVGDGAPRVECGVRDQGPGFPPEELPRAFEPFFTRRTGGVGLGLPIVQRIVEEHHGTVSVGNRPEGGAEVRVCLPTGG
ncbi:PAS domain S-box protein [Archangium violaceum]|uniref:two-component system sensor histidine kinase NtrB n=1 Tax=Archangium violaceum TaxID=83451 RepID=UPI00194F97AC|nr:ATP-binding protein [Archangium violaceum]QRN98398.1 PAS domain S-box protein [Archangium violaceum]